ncbi:MAG: sulfatase [Opitutaceae bacterium]|nr:sulfatase [Opitutaceae bacterium]
MALSLHPLRFFGCILLACASLETRAVDERKPNIVLFVADDLSTRDTGVYGASRVRTPQLDALARESLRFERAFAASPTCVPSRAALYTGLMPFRNGAHPNHSQCREGVQSLAHYFAAAGYQVVQAGKRHFAPQSVFPWDRIADSEVPEPGFEAQPGLRTDLDVAAVDRWLARRTDSRPLFLIVADHSPHVVWPERATFDPAEADVPPNHIDTPDTRRARARYYTDIEKMDRNLAALVASLRARGLWDNTAFLFTSDQGAQWAFAKWTLYDPGISVPLLVRWPGKTRPGTHTDALVSLVDIVPTLLEGVGAPVPADLDGKSFLGVVLGRTARHRDAVFTTHTGDRQWNRSPARSIRTERYKLIVNLAPQEVYTTHMDLAKDHDGGREYWPSWEEAAKTDPLAARILDRYRHHPPEELYDVQLDPFEQLNLASDSRYTGILADLRARLAAWREEQGDRIASP